MLSALISSIHSYPAMQLAPQQVHQRYVHPGPLVLEAGPLKFLTPTTDRDRTVSRRSEPSSRATLMGEQPNPWDLLQPRSKTQRYRHENSKEKEKTQKREQEYRKHVRQPSRLSRCKGMDRCDRGHVHKTAERGSPNRS